MWFQYLGGGGEKLRLGWEDGCEEAHLPCKHNGLSLNLQPHVKAEHGCACVYITPALGSGDGQMPGTHWCWPSQQRKLEAQLETLSQGNKGASDRGRHHVSTHGCIQSSHTLDTGIYPSKEV